MEFVKYFTSEMFEKEKFVSLLRVKMNVRARTVEDGIILDRDAYNAIPASTMPHWAYMMKKYINSPLHTRPATPDEWPALTPNYRYMLALLYKDNDPCQLEGSDGLEYISEQADEVANFWRDEDSFYGVAVIDNTTGEIVHIAE